jgi:hypothetical protein
MGRRQNCLFLLIIFFVNGSHGYSASSAIFSSSPSSSLWRSSSNSHPLVIGTRGSPLALAQAKETKSLLEINFPELENKIVIKTIMTQVCD